MRRLDRQTRDADLEALRLVFRKLGRTEAEWVELAVRSQQHAAVVTNGAKFGSPPEHQARVEFVRNAIRKHLARDRR
jgi:hypothetical protein